MPERVTVILAASHDGTGVVEHTWSTVAYRDLPGEPYANRQFLPIISSDFSVILGSESIFDPISKSSISSLSLINADGMVDDYLNHTWGGYTLKMYTGWTDQAFSQFGFQRSAVFRNIKSVSSRLFRFDIRDALQRFNTPIKTNIYGPGSINAGKHVPVSYGRVGSIAADVVTDTKTETTYYTSRSITIRYMHWEQRPNFADIDSAYSGGKQVDHPVVQAGGISSSKEPRANIRKSPSTDNKFVYTQYTYKEQVEPQNFFYRFRYDSVTGLPPVKANQFANVYATWTQSATNSDGYLVASGDDYNGANSDSLVLFMRTGLVPQDNTVVTHPDGTFRIDTTPNGDSNIIYNKDILSQEFRIVAQGETSPRDYYDILNPQLGDEYHEPGDIVHMMLSEHFTDADIQLPNLEQLNSDLPYDSGLHLQNGEGALDGIRQLMSSGYQMSVTNDEDSKFRIFLLDEPSPAATKTIDENIIDKAGIEIFRTHEAVWRIRVHCTQNTAPISQPFDVESHAKNPVEYADFIKFAKPYQQTREWVHPNGKVHAEQQELEFECGLYDEDGTVAQAEANRLGALYGVDRTIYKIPVKFAFFGLTPGDSVIVKYPRYGLDDGVPCRTLQIKDDPYFDRSFIWVWR